MSRQKFTSKKAAFKEHLQDVQRPEPMDGCGKRSRVIKCALKESQELLNFNLRTNTDSCPDLGKVKSALAETTGRFCLHFSRVRMSHSS